MSAIQDAMRATLRDIADDRVLVPATRAALLDPKFKGFTVPVQEWTPRPWDGWFHPSTHATWTARQLYIYLTSPGQVEQEQMTLNSILAITLGHFMHEFLQRLWISLGLLESAEIPLVDEVHKRRGHMDGRRAGEGVEIKTMNDRTLPKMTCWEELKERKPEYYAQGQDYLAMSGMPQMRFFFISTSYPYPMQEFVMPADPQYQAQQRLKYREALDGAARGVMPPPCCKLKSATARSCPTRAGCEIGRAS